LRKKKRSQNASGLYTPAMDKKEVFSENDLASLAKKFRKASGKNRAQAARDLHVSRPSVFDAEESPGQSLFKLRKRIIEKYSDFKVAGPEFRLVKK
jgi:hypothetical protein